jgi:hypothetical protein
MVTGFFYVCHKGKNALSTGTDGIFVVVVVVVVVQGGCVLCDRFRESDKPMLLKGAKS